MQAQRITREEILGAVRSSGAAEGGEIAAVVLETDGSISVIPDAGATGSGRRSQLRDRGLTEAAV